MIKIYSQKLNDRFYQNLILSSNNHWNIIPGDNIDIYKIHTINKYDIYIFDSLLIMNDIAQFISEYGDMGSKIYIYHHPSRVNKDCIRYIKKAKHLVDYDTYAQFKQYTNVIQLPKYLINTSVFKDLEISKKNQTIYFLDYDHEIPEYLQDKLYPSSKEKILLFNNTQLKHPQNLGTLSEIAKNSILNESMYFINNRFNEYLAEAIVCGCKVVNIDTVPHTDEFTTYVQFLKDKII